MTRISSALNVRRTSWGLALALAMAFLPGPLLSAAGAQPARQGQPPGPGAQAGVPPAELQRLFDSYVLMRAQEDLRLTDEQFPRFLTRMKALQDARRRAESQRMRILQELRRLTQRGDAEDEIRERLKLLDDLDVRSGAEIKEALRDLDQVLDVVQQARFRILEEQTERSKLELLMRARQANRPRNQF